MEFYLYRHGKTTGNEQQLFNGVTDDPLCEDGIRILKELPAHSDIQKVFVTPLRRTQETASILFPNAKQIIVPGLSEMNYGVFEKRTRKDLEADGLYQMFMENNWTLNIPLGQSVKSYTEQVCSTVAMLVDEAMQDHEESITVVGHGGTINAIRSGLILPVENRFTWWKVVDNGGVWQFHIDDAKWKKKHQFTVVNAPALTVWD